MLERINELRSKYEHLKWWPDNQYQSIDDVNDPWRSHLDDRLVDSETVRYGVDLKDGRMNAGREARARIFVTDHRIIWIKQGWTSWDVDTFQLDAVSAVTYDRGLTKGTITVTGSGFSEEYTAHADLAERFANRASQITTEQKIDE